MAMTEMKKVERNEYIGYLRAYPALKAKPTEGYNFSVMQYIDDNGKLMAQGVYHKGGFVSYYIR